MQHRDNMTTAMKAFMNQLPDPKLSDVPATSAKFIVQGEQVELIAQRIKGESGFPWKIYPKRQYNKQSHCKVGAKVVTVSDSDGFIYDPRGIDEVKLDYIKILKNNGAGRIGEYARKFT